MSINWQEVNCKDYTKAIEQANAMHEREMFDKNKTLTQKAALSFYDSFYALKLSNNKTIPATSMYFVSNGENVEKIDFKPETIYKINEVAGLKLDQSNILEYLGFFFANIRNNGYRLSLINDVSDLELKINEMSDITDNIDNYLFPPKATADEKGFYASSCVLLGNNLFAISSHIDNQGKVEILSEEVLLKDLPVHLKRIR